MQARSVAETISVEDGVVQIAFDLTGSSVGYLIITVPGVGGDAEGNFFGHDHYVELKDQLFGRYGGLSSIDVQEDNKLEIRLNYDVLEIGNSVSIITYAPLDPEVRAHLQQLKGSS